MLAAKLKAYEEKLLVGSGLEKKAVLQEKELRRKRVELHERERQERQLALELEERRRDVVTLEEKCVDLMQCWCNATCSIGWLYCMVVG